MSRHTHRDRAPDIGGAEIGDAQDEKDVGQLLLLLATEGVVDLVGGEGKAILGVQPDVSASLSKEASMEFDVEAADRVVVAVQKSIVRVRPRWAMVLDAEEAAAGDPVDQLLETAFGEGPEEHPGDSLAARRKRLSGRLFGTRCKTSQARAADAIDEVFDAAPLELEISGCRLDGVTAERPRDGQDLANFPYPGERGAGEDVLEGAGEPLEVCQRDRQSEERRL